MNWKKVMRGTLGIFVLSLLTGCGNSRKEASTIGADANPSELFNCQDIPSCDTPFPSLPPKRPFKGLIKPFGEAFHRGHDAYYAEGDTQWVIGKFTYGSVLYRGSMRGEEVDIYLLRGCGSTWEKIGTVETASKKGNGPEIEGIPDEAGRIFFEISEAKRLSLGRHKIRLVVAGDHSYADLFVEVLPKTGEVPLFVSDVDGTLTTSELEELGGVITNSVSQANEGAAEALRALVAKGYRPVYLTARPEFLVQRTRDFLAERGFPAGRIETSLEPLIGLTGEKSITYKSNALSRLQDKGFRIEYGIGNTNTDVNAYENAGIPVQNRFFYKYTDDTFNGTRIDSYGTLANFKSAADYCR